MPFPQTARRCRALAALVLAAALTPWPAAGQTAAPSATGLREDPAKVLEGTPTVGAITMLPGETYHGPGPITVGYLGAKKQLVLPNGAWVLLAVADRPSQHTPPVPLVSMAFGQFQEGRLVTLMSYLFNGRTAPRHTWPEVEECHAQKVPRGAAHEASAQGSTRVCGWTVRTTSAPHVVDPAWEQAIAVAAKLGSAVPPPPLQFTRAWATDRLGNYLGLRRADFTGAPLHDKRTAWLHEYLPFMLEGLDKKIGAAELEPNDSKPPRVRITLPD